MGTYPEDWKTIESLGLPAGFSVCELGNQVIGFSHPPRSTRDSYVKLGATRYCAIDGNGKGTYVWDLNVPLDVNARHELGQFDLVTDFGTGEHIFDQAQVWRTMHDLAKVGGWIVMFRPSNGYDKHCYYKINPCLINEIALANNYKLLGIDVSVTGKGKLVRAAMQKQSDAPFKVPQQNRYHAQLTPIMGGKSG